MRSWRLTFVKFNGLGTCRVAVEAKLLLFVEGIVCDSGGSKNVCELVQKRAAE